MKFNYSVDQVTTILKVTRRTVYNYLKCGELEAYKEGKEWRIPEESLLNFIKNGKSKDYKYKVEGKEVPKTE